MQQKTHPVLICLIILGIIATAIIMVTLAKGTETSGPAYPGPDPEIPETTAQSMMRAIPTQPSLAEPAVSEKEAIVRLQEEYPESLYTLSKITLTDRYPGKLLYECAMVPSKGSMYEKNATFYIDSATGDLYNPLQENAGITVEQAKEYAKAAFPRWQPDRVRIKFNDGSTNTRNWEFYLYKNEEELVHGSLDADRGELTGYSIGVKHAGRPQAPSITRGMAESIANTEIRERNNNPDSILGESRYDPLGMPEEKVAGKYVFVYHRLIHDVACDNDGFTISVDSVSGDVIEYAKRWNLPEESAASSSVPTVSKDTAMKTVMNSAIALYPESAGDIQIISAELRWMDQFNPDKFTPAPGTIPLAWKVRFDDGIIRNQQWPNPGTGWVDAQNGSVLDMYYRH